MIKKIFTKKKELLLLVIVLSIAGFAHGYNMFHFPYYENDEGTYVAQAWSVLTQGRLAPYTYWYDHAPVGWFLIAIWSFITGGFFTFGLSVNSGRVFMLVIHVLSTLLVYLITKRLTKSSFAGALAGLLFSLTPLGIYYQRRVLLDNMMIFWVLLSFYWLLGTGRKLRHFLLSAVTYAIAILVKESAIFFFPAFFYIVYAQAHKAHRTFAVVKWLAITFGIISLYVIYAILKGELFPTGTLLGGSQPHVSLIETLTYQMGRSGEGSFLSPDGAFQWNMKTHWLAKDALLMILGGVATVTTLLLGIKKQLFRYISFLTACYWLYLMRGGIVIEFYVVPLIPLLAISIAVTITAISNLLRKMPLGKIIQTLPYFAIFISLPLVYKDKTDIYTTDQTSNQVKAIEWIKNNVSPDSIIVIDNYAYVDLNSKIPGSISIQKEAEYYWKADKDPEIKINLLKNDWRNVDYILFSDQMKYDIYHAGLDLVREAYENSDAIEQYLGTGYDIEIRKVTAGKRTLTKAWDTYKKNFSSSDGAVWDSFTNRVTSEGQAYSLLRAVWMDDKKEFDNVLKWTNNNMMLKDKNLFAWLYGKNSKNDTLEVLDKGTATDADQDIALALLFAYKKWGQSEYLTQAKKIITDIWQYETVEVNSKRYVVAGNWASEKQNKIYTINPSYISPYAYRIFAEVDTKHDWNSVVDTSYEVLQACSTSPLGEKNSSVGIPPDWCAINRKGEIVDAENINTNAKDYSYDAIRTLWRIALDFKWYKDERAYTYMLTMKDFWKAEWSKRRIFSNYSHDGTANSNKESLAHYGAQLAFFSTVDTKTADDIQKAKILNQWNSDGHWGGKDNYYDQNWVWFGTALFTNNLPNIWNSN